VVYVTVFVKISRWLSELFNRRVIKLGSVMRKALEEEVRRRVLGEFKEEAKGLSEKLSHIPDEEVTLLIRGDGEGRG